MLVRLIKREPPDGWCELYASGRPLPEAVRVTPRLEAMMPGGSGYFYAERIGNRWEVRGPAPVTE